MMDILSKKSRYLKKNKLFSDPDAPSRKRPKNRSFQHWIVGNIPGNNVSAGDTLTECKKKNNSFRIRQRLIAYFFCVFCRRWRRTK